MYEPAHGSLVFRYELPQPGTAQKNDLAAWQEAVDNSMAQLEHQVGRQVLHTWCLHVRLCESSLVDCICGHTTVHVCVYKTILCTCNCHKTVHVYVGTRLYMYMWAQLRLYLYVCLHKTVHVHVYRHKLYMYVLCTQLYSNHPLKYVFRT